MYESTLVIGQEFNSIYLVIPMLTGKHHRCIAIIFFYIDINLHILQNFIKSFIIVAGSLMQRLYSICESPTKL